MAIITKTPGVYIEEVSKFPPTVAQVETAIPAFIGYTNSAKEILDNDLRGKPVRVTSMRQFEQLFGGAPTQEITLTLASNTLADGTILTLPVSAALTTDNPHKMYHAVQAFYAKLLILVV